MCDLSASSNTGYSSEPQPWLLPDRNIAEHITLKEKESLAELIFLLKKMSQQSLRCGLLKLEKFEIPDKIIQADFLKTFIHQSIDGTDPDIIRQMGETLLIFSAGSPAEKLAQYIIVNAVLKINFRLNSSLLEVMLITFLGHEYRERYYRSRYSK